MNTFFDTCLALPCGHKGYELLIIFHYWFLGKIATGGVVAKIAVLNIAINPSMGFAALLKKTVGREGEKKSLLKYTTFM